LAGILTAVLTPVVLFLLEKMAWSPELVFLVGWKLLGQKLLYPKVVLNKVGHLAHVRFH
jgi:hypothetical protein